MSRCLCAVAALFLLAPALPTAREPDEATRLHLAFDAYFEELLVLDPIFATEIGDRRYDDRLPNYLSEEYRSEERAFRRRWLETVGAFDREALEEQDRLSYDIFLREQRMALRDLEFPRHLLPVNQLFGMPSLFARMGAGDGDHPFETEKDYRDFLARIHAWVPLADQIVANLEEGVRRGVVQPKIVVRKALPQIERQVVEDPTTSDFYRPLLALPASIGPDPAEALRREYRTAIREEIVPAYRRILDALRDRYLPACRDSVSLSALPNGTAWYAHLVEKETTSHLSPDEIHALGLSEVERIRDEMGKIPAQVGFEGDLPAFLEHLRADRSARASSARELLAAYGALRERVGTALPRLFDFPVSAPLEIRPVPDAYAADAPAAVYDAGAPDGSRPGVFWVNTHDLEARPLYQTEALFLHEAIPGHHYQSSIARAAGELPRFRRFVLVNAYLEGWALYSESLGGELGLYRDPLMRFGRLDDEMLRAVRLVVDTGLHAKGWTRQEAIDYMAANTAMGAGDIEAEVDRYIVLPAQALSYKLGELTIRRLRTEAERALGDRFDVRAFHHAILAHGVLPLDVLESEIDDWLVEREGLREPVAPRASARRR
ncbi:MAG: DUF885 domain-containing protein [Thermoanaerobaculia bacterium]